MTAKTPRAAELNVRVEILQRSETIEDDAGVSVSFVSQGTFWAMIKSQRSALTSFENERAARISKIFVLRAGVDVNVADHLACDGEEFEILGVENIGGWGSFVELSCQAINATGASS